MFLFLSRLLCRNMKADLLLMRIFKQLIAFLIVVAVLLVPLHSVAHDLKSGTLQDLCVCHLLPADGSADRPGELSDHSPGNNSGDCCDSEDCNPEASGPPAACKTVVQPSGKQLFYSDSSYHIHPVYLAIFVPPES